MPRVLIVDGYPNLRFMDAFLLRTLDCEVVEAAETPQALQVLERGQQIDLILVHLKYEARNELQFIEYVHQQHPEIPIFAASLTWRDLSPGEEAVQKGAAGYLFAPVKRQDLERILQEQNLLPPAFADSEA